jgi:cytochrome c oxidase subunit 2
VELGKEFNFSKTCSSCHSDDGSVRVGPSFKGLFGKSEEMTDGKTITVDEVYLREAMMDPNKTVVKGFAAGAMPPFKGQLSDDNVNALVAYIKSLK